MSKNPIINALSASGYIFLVVTIMNYIMQTQGNKPDPAFAPVIFISLLTLSVSVMGYLFFYQPLQLILDGKKKAGVDLFIKTVGIFGAVTLLIALLIFSGLM